MRGGNPQILGVYSPLRDPVPRTGAPTGESQFGGLHCQARGGLRVNTRAGPGGTLTLTPSALAAVAFSEEKRQGLVVGQRELPAKAPRPAATERATSTLS